ncbi:glyoxalase [Paenibacillus campi]|uniref:glyoxalase n=1 Tax=Paenibacillus campi TaxID=3106031 RepID=UPI002AFDDFD1|nr:glyoxalase [Paenibacillus sp. SGZ-1014]
MTSITQLTLYTAELERMHEFYALLLGTELITEQEDAFTILSGQSSIQFRVATTGTKPFYHIAINIAANHFQEAKHWLSKAGKLLTENGEDEAYFSFLDAYSCYIEDPAGNIIELISRQQYAPMLDVPFSPAHLLGIGEMNITTIDVKQTAKLLYKAGFPVQPDEIDDTGLNFVGQQDVYLLVGPAGRRWLFSDRVSEIHPVQLQMSTGVQLSVLATGELVTCTAEK